MNLILAVVGHKTSPPRSRNQSKLRRAPRSEFLDVVRTIFYVEEDPRQEAPLTVN